MALSADQYVDYLERVLRSRIPVATALIGEAYAEELRTRVPVLTGTLRLSITYVAKGEQGGVVMRMYARYIDRGHRVWNWNTSARTRPPAPPLKTDGFVAARPTGCRAISRAPREGAESRPRGPRRSPLFSVPPGRGPI